MVVAIIFLKNCFLGVNYIDENLKLLRGGDEIM
jgi:hypothetical protein